MAMVEGAGVGCIGRDGGACVFLPCTYQEAMKAKLSQKALAM